MTIALCCWVVLAAAVWHTCVCVSGSLGHHFSPHGCLYTPGSASVCLLGHLCLGMSFSVPTSVSLGVCVCCANTAVAAWSQGLLGECFLVYFFFLLAPTPTQHLTQCPPQSSGPSAQVPGMASLRSPSGMAPEAEQPWWSCKSTIPTVTLERKLHTDGQAGDKHRLRVTFTSFFMKLNVAPGLGGRYSARRTLYMLLNSDIPGWPDFGQLQHQQTLDFWALQTVSAHSHLNWNEPVSSFHCPRTSPNLGNSVSMASNSCYGKANLSFC